MAETTTPRLGLIKPAKDIQTPLDIDRINLNMDKLDLNTGASNVADGTTPLATELYDGKIVREKTSGKVWIAELQANGSYTKRWLKYPYLYVASTGLGGGFNNPPDSVWRDFGWIDFWPGSFNAPATEKVAGSNFWKAPFNGIFHFKSNTYWRSAAALGQVIAAMATVNGSQDSANTQSTFIGNGGAWANTMWIYTRYTTAGTIIGQQIFVGPGNTMVNIYSSCEVTCVERLD